jgi:transposase-like protein
MAGKKRRKYSAEFKAEVVKLVLQGGRTRGSVAEELGVPSTCVSHWVAQAETDAGRGEPGALTTDERVELAQLRRDNKRLLEEREILKKAAAFFAKENG